VLEQGTIIRDIPRARAEVVPRASRGIIEC